MVETLNAWSYAWIGLMGAILWQSTLLAVVIAAACWLLRRSSPAVRYWLWQIVAIKLLLMPFWSMAIPWPEFGKADPAETAVVDNRGETKPAAGSGFPLPPITENGSAGAEVAEAPAEPFLSWLRAIAWPTWLLLAWIVVIFWQAVRIIRQRYRLGRLLRAAQPAEASLETWVQEMSGQLGLRRTPRVLVTEECGSPFVCGLSRPVLVMPKSVLASLMTLPVLGSTPERFGPL